MNEHIGILYRIENRLANKSPENSWDYRFRNEDSSLLKRYYTLLPVNFWKCITVDFLVGKVTE